MFNLKLLKDIIDDNEKRLGGADPSDMRQAARVVWGNYLNHFVDKPDGRSLRQRIDAAFMRDYGVEIRCRTDYKVLRDEYVDNLLVCGLTMVLPT